MSVFRLETEYVPPSHFQTGSQVPNQLGQILFLLSGFFAVESGCPLLRFDCILKGTRSADLRRDFSVSPPIVLL